MQSMHSYSSFRWLPFLGAAAVLVIMPVFALADGISIDKVYHPYVQPLEREIEARSLYLNDGNDLLDGTKLYRLGFGKSFSERILAELYVIGADEPGRNLSLDAYELELKWQLTEQGEFFADWGLLFELEAERDQHNWEYGTTLLVEKEFGRWTGALNLSVIYEWGSNIRNEWETGLATQWRYRYSPAFEPAIELYSGDQSKGLGPVALGAVRFAEGRKLRWELGLIFGLDSESPDQTLRAMLEFEF